MFSTLLHRALQLIAAVFLPLAAGALWSALSLKLRADLPFMAFACALATWPARAHLTAMTAAARAVVCAAICAVGIAYAYWLKSAAVIAGSVGVEFYDALCLMGSDLAFAIAHARGGTAAMLCVVAALLVSSWIGWRGERARVTPRSVP
jgi:hypothetical protein